jgi:hypothetical protein
LLSNNRIFSTFLSEILGTHLDFLFHHLSVIALSPTEEGPLTCRHFLAAGRCSCCIFSSLITWGVLYRRINRQLSVAKWFTPQVFIFLDSFHYNSSIYWLSYWPYCLQLHCRLHGYFIILISS